MGMNERTSKLLRGAVAGMCATLPMTVFMQRMFRELPRSEQYPLPPAEITSVIEQRLGLRKLLTPEAHRLLTMAAHIGYGGAGGALYGITAEGVSQPAMTKGFAYGLFLWSVSYLGWLPKLNILRSAVDHPFRRNLLMITAHLVWGSLLALLVALARYPAQLRRAKNPKFETIR